MIAPQVPQMWRELLETATHYHESHRIGALKAWRKKWCKDIHVARSFSRNDLEHRDGEKLRRHTHRNMHFELADYIHENKLSLLQRDFLNSGEDPNPNPNYIEDRLTVYILGAK